MKRKILLCALSFIAVALFSCGIAFLPNWNPKPTTPPSDIGQEGGGSGDDVTEAYTGRIRYCIRNYIYYTENGQEKTAECPNMQESFATLNYSIGITQGGVDYNWTNSSVTTRNSFSNTYTKTVDAGWLIYAVPKIKLNSITYNKYDVTGTYEDFVELKEIYVGAAATEMGMPSKGSKVSLSTLKSGYDTGVRINNDANNTVTILVSIYWEGQPLDFEVQFDDPDSTADYTLTASVDFGTPLPNVLTNTFFSNHGMNSAYAGVNFAALNQTGKYCRSASNKRNSSYVPTLVNNVIVSSDIGGVSIGHYDYVLAQAAYYSSYENQYTSIDQYLCSKFDKYYEYDGSDWNLTGEDNKYVMNHIYLGLVYPETNMTLDRNGGSGGTSSIRAMYRAEIMQESITVPTRTGYRFAGYEYNDSLVYNSSGVLQTNTTWGDKPIYLWNTILGSPEAQWTPNTYSVKFYRNHSSSDTTTSTQSGFTYDQSKALQANPWTKTGYTFKGWSTSRTATTATYTNGQSVKNLTSTNGGTVNLYAVWTPNTYSVKFYRNHSSSDNTTSTQSGFTYDQSKALQANPWTKTGYTFKGWSTSRTATTATYTNGQSVENLTSTNGGTVNLYAVWAIDSYTLTIDPNGGTLNGSTSTTTQTVSYRDMINLATPTRTGYTFKGWQVTSGDATVTETQYLWEEQSFDGVDDYIAIGRDQMYTDSITVSLMAYMDNWSLYGSRNMRLISCTEGGGWNFESNNGYIQVSVYDSGVGYKHITLTKQWSSLSSGWHSFTLSFDGHNARLFIDGVMEGKSADFSSGEIGYNSTNGIFIGAEAYSSTTTPASTNLFEGIIESVIIVNDYVYGADFSQAGSFVIVHEDTTIRAIWEDTWARRYTMPEGSGTEEDPYRVSTASELAYFAYKTQIQGQESYDHIVLTDDIDLAGYDWLPMGRARGTNTGFRGAFDGQGHTISNLNVNESGIAKNTEYGLFGLVDSGAVIKNFSIISGQVNGFDNSTGAVAGYIWSATIDNVTNYANVTGNRYIGGIVGQLTRGTTISNCFNYGNVQGINYVGGVVGGTEDSTATRSIVGVTNMGQVSGHSQVGGIIGRAYHVTVESAYNGYTASVTATTRYAGGVVGYLMNGSTVLKSVNTADVAGESCVGGLLGGAVNGGSLTTSYSEGLISARGSSVTEAGTLVGGASTGMAIADCYFKGTSNKSIGTYYGSKYVPATISNCYVKLNGTLSKTAGAFDNWTIVSGVNDNDPIQKELFYLAGYTGGDALVDEWLG